MTRIDRVDVKLPEAARKIPLLRRAQGLVVEEQHLVGIQRIEDR